MFGVGQTCLARCGPLHPSSPVFFHHLPKVFSAACVFDSFSARSFFFFGALRIVVIVYDPCLLS
jgi:hypothetical protein